jgi:cytoskeletal protein CcmA (bactofilin family)
MATEGNGEFPTIIGPDAKFKGDLDFEKGVRVFGHFEGTIKSKGQLHIAKGAQVKADVTAGNIDVDGDVKGNLTANGKVQLKATAKLEGDLRTARLEVADGATFIGNCIVGPTDSGKAAPPARQDHAAPQSREPAAQPQGKKG